MRTAPFAEGFFVGDYEGLTSIGRRFAPGFVTANSGNLANRTDLFSTTVRPEFGGSPFAAALLAHRLPKVRAENKLERYVARP